MEIVLLENIKNLGKIGDTVSVKRGYGRNFLIKYGKALKASEANIGLVNKKKAELNEKNITLKKNAKNFPKMFQKFSTNVPKIVRSCLLITLIKCVKSHRSLGSLFVCQK